MNKQEAISILKEHNQEHVVKRLEALGDDAAKKLISQVAMIDWKVVESIKDKAEDKGEAKIAFNAIIGPPQLADDPTARNSKRFPVNAKGDVRLRSVLSNMISGILPTFNFNSVFSSGLIFRSLTFSTNSSSIPDK